MKLSLQLILETLTEYGAQLIETDGDFTFTGVQNWEVIPGIPDAAAAIKAEGSEDLYVVTCFSDRDKLLNLPDVKKEG